MHNRHSAKIAKLFHRLIVTAVPVVIVLFTYPVVKKLTGGEWNIIFPARFTAFILLCCVVILAFCNWFIEAWKWKLMTDGTADYNWITSCRAILVGITLGFVTPGRIGDYYGKNWYAAEHEKRSGMATAIVGGIIQTVITFFIGISALCVTLVINPFSASLFISPVTAIVISAVTGLFLLMCLFTPAMICKPLQKINFPARMIRLFKDAIAQFSSRQIFYFLGLSLIRYAVFASQFLLLLIIFNIQETYLILILKIALVFFFSTFIPSLFLGKLGIRETFAVLLIGVPLEQNKEVLFASLSLWIINQVLPAILGYFVMILPKPKEIS